ncbi:MAG TPA: L-histidine N(alpha)-methyltransferase [Methylocella sp.]|nr:L-histidine N(alpha)-methyltransferase [Methylocella sp.]
MMGITSKNLFFPKTSPIADGSFVANVVEGLSRPRKTLPCRYFYDATGSRLFEEITQEEEYYLTRAEIEILEKHAGGMAPLPDGALLVEFGSGSSRKTEILLKNLRNLAAYVPIDVSQTALYEAGHRLAVRFPTLRIHPIKGDFSHPVEFPPNLRDSRKLGFFPGSTIGNFCPPDAGGLLAGMRIMLAPAGRLLIGVDLKKDPQILVRAYNDRAGVTAAFNLNLLARINRELGGTFDLEGFRHRAVYEPREGRIEMHLVSLKNQTVQIGDMSFRFRREEMIHTENSYKYTVGEFQDLARQAGWRPSRFFTDAAQHFSVHELVAD